MLYFQQTKHICMSAFLYTIVFARNKFLKTEFVIHFQRSLFLWSSKRNYFMCRIAL